MIVKFLQDYKHTVKQFREGHICSLDWQLADELLKEKIVTDKLSRREVKKLEQRKTEGIKDGK